MTTVVVVIVVIDTTVVNAMIDLIAENVEISTRKRGTVITESEFLSRRESVDRSMLVRQIADRTQIAIIEDNLMVEHYVNRNSNISYVGNVIPR
jgi:hypothetical protein